MVSDVSALTIRSYGHDLLRWWRVLSMVEVPWDRAARAEVELMVSWMRTADNPQRRRTNLSAPQAGSVNVKTGKPLLGAGYAASTINHAVTVVAGFYDYHRCHGRGPLINPVPASGDRARLGQRAAFDGRPHHRRGPLRQRQPVRAPRSIPDARWSELVGALTHDRDRALFECAVASGARASELLGVRGEHVDWGERRLWVTTKGTREVEAVPASSTALELLARYFDHSGTPRPDEPVWRTLRGDPRPLTYWALRRVMQRANYQLATNWTFHDIRHTAAARMAGDPELTLPEVQSVMRHRHLTTTELYLIPRIEELHDKVQEHFSRPRPIKTFAPGYSADDIAAVFGE
ncbi:integrase [Rhodococcoides kyotonense]|uniref:Integrase n=1 Tax=Rhodococcoides kyotonense TaxID=398843 RepID=A0A177YEH8_9NOCA|nr:integrase [Rhodococcus kyotonensis]